MKVTFCDDVPNAGTVLEFVQAKVPGTLVPLMATEADPPVRVEEASVWPKAIALAVGNTTVGTVWKLTL